MKNKLIYLLLVGLLIASCSKEKKAKNNLIGKWNAKVMTAVDEIDGSPLDLIAMGESMTLDFKDCGNDGFCPVTVELSLDGEIEVFETHYILDSSGDSMTILYTFESEVTIIELSSDELIISSPTFVYGNDLYVELEKE